LLREKKANYFRQKWRPLYRISRPYDLVNEKEKYKSIADEMDQTFSELAGY